MFNLFRRKRVQEIDYGPSRLQSEYNNAFHTAYGSGYRTVQNAPSLLVEFSDSNISTDIEQALQDIGSIQIEQWDHGKQRAELKRIAEKYEADFKEGRIGGIGSPIPEAFINLAEFALGFFFKWGLDHIIADIDTKIWEELKKRIVRIYKKISNKDQERVAFVTSSRIFRHDKPTISFILPAGLEDSEFEECLGFIATRTTSLIASFPKSIEQQHDNFYQFTYNKDKKQWEIIKKSASPLA